MLVHQLTKAKKALDAVSDYDGIDFAYAVFKNKKLIDNKLMEVDFIKNVSPQIVEYENKRVSLCEEFAQKDDNGIPMIEDDLYVIEDKETFRNKMDELFEQYKPFIVKRQEQIDLFNVKMNQQVDLPFVKLTKEQIPPQITTAKELEDISFMIE
jgi:hypothetical protein